MLPPTEVTALIEIEEREEEVEEILVEETPDQDSSSSASGSLENEDQTDKSTESDNEEPEFEYSISNSDAAKAWKAAARLANRNPKIWRLDNQNNVILSREYTRASPLSFNALIKKDSSEWEIFEAVQSEFFGLNNENNHKNALKYRAKDQSQDDLLSLIEMALFGNVSDDFGESYCWCPSSIHQDLIGRDVVARRWHHKLFDSDFKYGMAGHNLAFQHMQVYLKDVRRISENVLNNMDQKNTLLYIHNFQPQCSEVVKSISFTVDAKKEAENVKTNWGLTRVSAFLEQADKNAPVPSAVMKKAAAVPKPKQALSVSAAYPPTKSASASMSVSENEWPSLSPGPSHKTKSTKIISEKATKIMSGKAGKNVNGVIDV